MCVCVCLDIVVLFFSFLFFFPSSSSHPGCSSIRIMTRRRFTSRSRFLSYGEAADTQRGLRKSLVPPWLPSPRNGVDSIQPAIRSTMLYVANVNYEGNERWPRRATTGLLVNRYSTRGGREGRAGWTLMEVADLMVCLRWNFIFEGTFR